MAVSGGCCGGYVYQLKNGVLVVIHNETRLRGAFDSVGDAAAKLLRGEQAAALAEDNAKLRAELDAAREGADFYMGLYRDAAAPTPHAVAVPTGRA